MDVTRDDEAVLYVTLLQAAEEVGGSPEDLRAAARRQRIRAVKENPKNKRSRWLVALEDVRNLNQADGQDTSEAQSNTREHPEDVNASEAMASGDSHPAHRETAASHQQIPQTPEPTPNTHHESQPEDETPELTHLEAEPSDDQESQVLDPMPDTHHKPLPEDETPVPIDRHLPHFPSRGQMETSPAIIAAAPGRGEELVERLIDAIDRLSSTAPEAPFDYQALLDNYVVAVENRSQAEVRAATLQRRLDDAHEQVAHSSVRLEQAHAQNRQLLSELEIVRAELDAARERDEGDEARPMWKRRSRQ